MTPGEHALFVVDLARLGARDLNRAAAKPPTWASCCARDSRFPRGSSSPRPRTSSWCGAMTSNAISSMPRTPSGAALVRAGFEQATIPPQVERAILDCLSPHGRRIRRRPLQRDRRGLAGGGVRRPAGDVPGGQRRSWPARRRPPLLGIALERPRHLLPRAARTGAGPGEARRHRAADGRGGRGRRDVHRESRHRRARRDDRRGQRRARRGPGRRTGHPGPLRSPQHAPSLADRGATTGAARGGSAAASRRWGRAGRGRDSVQTRAAGRRSAAVGAHGRIDRQALRAAPGYRVGLGGWEAVHSSVPADHRLAGAACPARPVRTVSLRRRLSPGPPLSARHDDVAAGGRERPAAHAPGRWVSSRRSPGCGWSRTVWSSALPTFPASGRRRSCCWRPRGSWRWRDATTRQPGARTRSWPHR